jgi:iron-sulfur cluster assembly accessory protein
MAVTLTEAAARHVTRYLSRGKGVGVRLGVKTTGCSGLAYKLEYADEVAPEDIVFEEHGVKVLVDPRACPTSTAPSWTSSAKAERRLQVPQPAREGPLRLRESFRI